jgi:hypothetical protein
VDSTVYYFGGNNSVALSTTALISAIPIPKKGRIKTAIVRIYCTVGTNENAVMVIRKNNTTDYTFDTENFSANPVIYKNYLLNIPVDAGDVIEFKLTTPAWAGNPADLRPLGSMIIECP